MLPATKCCKLDENQCKYAFLTLPGGHKVRPYRFHQKCLINLNLHFLPLAFMGVMCYHTLDNLITRFVASPAYGPGC